MSERYLMGLDFGGGGGRCLLVSPETGRVVVASRPWTHRVAAGSGGIGYDLDLDALFLRIAEASREALERAGAGPRDILGVATTSMRFGLVVLDAAGQGVLAVPNRDGRAAGQGMELAASQGPELLARTGHWPGAIFMAARLRWLATQEERWSRADKALSISDWLAYRLSGEIATEPSQAGESLLVDLDASDWAWDRIDALELPRKLFPPILPCGSRIGALSAGAAKALGLAEGTPVSLGGGDTQCGLLGAGVVEPGALCAIAGTTAPVQMVSENPVVSEPGILWTGRHVVPDRWVLESNAGPMGEVLDWIAGVLFPDAPQPAACVDAEAAEARIGSGGILSSLGAEVMNGRTLALPMGSLSLTHLASPHDPASRKHLARSVLEGMAYGIRANVEQILEASGLACETLRLSGGMSRSALWSQILSETLNARVEVPRTIEASALGAAICAGVGAGLFEDVAAGSAKLVEIERQHLPEPANAAAYEQLFTGWQEVRLARADADGRAAGMALQAILNAPQPAEQEGAEPFRPRILVTADLDASGLAALRSLGEVEVQSYREVMRLLTGPDLVKALAGFDVFVTEIDVVDAAALAELPDLRVIAACRGDAVNIDLDLCSALGIPVLNTPGRNADAVADLALAFMLMLSRKLPSATAFLREAGGEAGDMGRMGRAFSLLRGRELWRKTVGLVGLGAVGRGVARRVRAFGARVLVYDPYLPDAKIRLAGAEPASLEELLSASDFVSLHAAVTDESRGLIGRQELARMKPDACLINTARAALIDEEALRAALESGSLGGAGLDVFAVEPPASDDPLLALPNVVATPHVGGNTLEVAAHQAQIVADDLIRLLRGQAPLHVLNRGVLEGFRWDQPRVTLDAAEFQRFGSKSGPAVTDLQRDKKARPGGRPEPKASAARGPSAADEKRQAMGRDPEEVREHMEKLLQGFIAGVLSDDALRTFAAGKETVLHFTLTDLDLDFHFGFEGDRVIGSMGKPAMATGVHLKLEADILDGMLTGRLNAMQAAMDGRLSFTGDTTKAMTIQQIQADMNRIYSAAREQVGDPGDLTMLATSSAKSDAEPARVEENDPRIELVKIVNELYSTQLITATGGNVSVRVPGTEDEIWITPSQLFKGDLQPEILVRINLEGEALDEGARSPSSERLMHAAVYKARPKVNAIIHAHAPHATILVNADLPFLPISTEAAFFANIPRIPFVMPGTPALGEAIVEAMGEGWACLMQNHGILVAGRSLRRAADMAEIIDRSAEIIVGCYSVGKKPPTLPKDAVDMLSKMGDLIA